jgi:hypothetical protein
MEYEAIVGEGRIEGWQKALGAKIWPEFMQHDEIVNRHWPMLYADFMHFQYAVLAGDEIVGIGNSVPLNWQEPFTELPDSGLDWAMGKANTDFKSGAKANLLVGIEILINEKYQGRGMSFRMLEIMKGIAKTNGIAHVALPLRPTLKSRYPLIPIADYVGWRNPDGFPFDPWLRVHRKAGGEIMGICERSMEISGSVSDWEKWTGLEFPGSGDFVVDGALVPVSIDHGEKTGKYFEPNVWVVHKTIEL